MSEYGEFNERKTASDWVKIITHSLFIFMSQHLTKANMIIREISFNFVY